AIEVPRSRFLPVKTTNDLLLLRSDVYELTDDFRLVASFDADAGQTAPLVDLDKTYYKLIDDFGARFPAGVPSLAEAESFTVAGDWTFGAGVVATGKAVLRGSADGAPGRVPDGATVGADGIA